MTTPKEQAQAMRTLARKYHELGFNVLPLDSNKKPVLTGGVSTNGQPFRFKWEAWAEIRQTPANLTAILKPAYWVDVAGVGGICGAVSGGAVCVDFDHTNHDGTVSTLLAALGLPADYAWVVRSGDGFHVWLRCAGLELPDGNGKIVRPSKQPGSQVEIRFTGHYAALPGSLHPSGKVYEWRHSEPTKPPAQVDAATLLAAYMAITKDPQPAAKTKPESTKRAAPSPTGAPKEGGRRQSWRDTALAGEVDNVRRATEGTRNDRLNTAAYSLGQLVGAGELDRSTVESELMAAALAVGLSESESSATIHSGLDSGVKSPRAYPGKPETAQPVKAGKGQATQEEGGDEPEDNPSVAMIEVSGQLSTLLDRTLAAVVKRNERNERYPVLLKRSGSLVRTVGSDHDTVIEPVVENAALAVLARSAKWVITRQSKDGEFLDDVFPPSAVVKAFTSEGEWDGLPELEGVVTGPVFAPDGRLHSAPGYDKGTRLFMAGQVVIGDTVPTAANIATAKRFILGELLGQFPFVDDASRAHAVALLLAPFVRAMIEGPTPLHIVSAPAAGSGKGLLTQACLIPALGRSPEAQGEATNPAEWQKLLTSILLKGRPIVYLDNVHGALTAAALATALTEASWTDRLLGASRQVTIPIRTTWVVTANNPALTQEMARRSVLIRLDSNTARPWERSGFRHNPIHFATQHRSELVTAAITLVNGWLSAGRPKWEGKAKGSYGEWCNVIGGILATVGIDGFLANDESLFAAAIDQGEHFQAFIEAWLDLHGTSSVTAKQLFALASEPDTPAAIPPSHPTNLLGALLGDKNERSRQIKLGNLLVKHRGMVFTVGNEPYKLLAGKNDGLSPIRGEPRYQLKAIRPESVVNVDQHSPPHSPPQKEDLHEWEAMKNLESGECGECGECDPILRDARTHTPAHAPAHTHTHAHVRSDENTFTTFTTFTTHSTEGVVNVDQHSPPHSPLPDDLFMLDPYIGRPLDTTDFLEANRRIHQHRDALAAHGLTIDKQLIDGQWQLTAQHLPFGAQEGKGAASQ